MRLRSHITRRQEMKHFSITCCLFFASSKVPVYQSESWMVQHVSLAGATGQQSWSCLLCGISTTLHYFIFNRDLSVLKLGAQHTQLWHDLRCCAHRMPCASVLLKPIFPKRMRSVHYSYDTIGIETSTFIAGRLSIGRVRLMTHCRAICPF